MKKVGDTNDDSSTNIITSENKENSTTKIDKKLKEAVENTETGIMTNHKNID